MNRGGYYNQMLLNDLVSIDFPFKDSVPKEQQIKYTPSRRCLEEKVYFFLSKRP